MLKGAILLVFAIGIGGELPLSFIEEEEIRCFQNKVGAGRRRSLVVGK